MEKVFWKSKLFWLGAIQIAMGVLALLGPFLEAGDFGPAGIIALVSGFLTIALRFITDEPIALKP